MAKRFVRDFARKDRTRYNDLQLDCKIIWGVSDGIKHLLTYIFCTPPPPQRRQNRLRSNYEGVILIIWTVLIYIVQRKYYISILTWNNKSLMFSMTKHFLEIYLAFLLLI